MYICPKSVKLTSKHFLLLQQLRSAACQYNEYDQSHTELGIDMRWCDE